MSREFFLYSFYIEVKYMHFKNLNTGVLFEIVDPVHIARCQKDKNYEEVKQEEPKVEKKIQINKKSKPANKVGE